MNRQETLAESILLSRQLLARYLTGFGDANHTAQPPHLPNHLAWTMGHLAMTMHRVAEKFDGRPLPPSDFISGADRGDTARFGTESVAFGSTPKGDPTMYPPCARCIEVFGAACERLAAAVRSSDDAQLDAMAPWGNAQTPLWTLAARMVFHNGTHTGEIADLRRALGMGSIFK